MAEGEQGEGIKKQHRIQKLQITQRCHTSQGDLNKWLVVSISEQTRLGSEPSEDKETNQEHLGGERVCLLDPHLNCLSAGSCRVQLTVVVRTIQMCLLGKISITNDNTWLNSTGLRGYGSLRELEAGG